MIVIGCLLFDAYCFLFDDDDVDVVDDILVRYFIAADLIVVLNTTDVTSL